MGPGFRYSTIEGETRRDCIILAPISIIRKYKTDGGRRARKKIFFLFC